MSKALVVAAGLSALQSAQSQAASDSLNAFYDSVVADLPPSGGFQQSDIDAAVKTAQDADAAALAQSQAADAQALTDAVAAVQSKLDASVQALADMTAKDQKDSAAALALKASIAGIQAALDSLNAIVAPPADPSAPASN